MPDTGLYSASQRAAHLILDNPKIFEDPLALRIIGAETESKLRLGLAQFQQPMARFACSHDGAQPVLRR